jgi:hypothetical protein
MAELEAIVYVVCAAFISWGLRGFRLVEVNNQAEGASYKSSAASSGGTNSVVSVGSRGTKA